MSQAAAAPIGTEVGMSSIANASTGVPVGAASAPGTPGAGVPVGGGGGLSGVLGAFSKLNGIASMFGKDPKEREANAKTFASLVKDVGNTVTDLSESTLMQRMMEASMGGPSYLSEGGNASGGVGAIPKTFDPSLASHIMNQMGYK